ncbi:hypothetical protein OAI23_06545, partial [Alphaproteobacteria bacterium]|nr:hypothetical protein [Alphaproteobacteria bacterium]
MIKNNCNLKLTREYWRKENKSENKLIKQLKPQKVAFFCDLNTVSGLGHIMRCKLLHDAMMTLGYVCTFLATDSEYELFSQNLDGRDLYVISSDTECVS